MPASKGLAVTGTTALSGARSATEAHVLPGGLAEDSRAPISASLGNIDPSQLVHSVQPVYPKEAKRQHVEGNVELRVVVGVDGKVEDVSLVSGLPLLASAAMDAACEFR